MRPSSRPIVYSLTPCCSLLTYLFFQVEFGGDLIQANGKYGYAGKVTDVVQSGEWGELLHHRRLEKSNVHLGEHHYPLRLRRNTLLVDV